MTPGAIFFDVDGVLIDSLPAHLAVCRDLARDYGLSIEIPSVDQFRRLVREGVRISPMREFFLAVGFPSKDINCAVSRYEKQFSSQYFSNIFPNVVLTLDRLQSAGWVIGIVTSNISANVQCILDVASKYLDPRCIFTLDRYDCKPTKAWCLVEGARLLGISSRSCIYVGDLPSDAEAADAARMRFIGVTYGWGIGTEDRHLDTVDDIIQLPALLSAQSNLAYL